MAAQTIIHEGITYTYKPHHGAWFQDPENEAIGTLHAAANRDGSFATDSIGEIEISAYDAAGEVCEIACRLCREEQARFAKVA